MKKLLALVCVVIMLGGCERETIDLPHPSKTFVEALPIIEEFDECVGWTTHIRWVKEKGLFLKSYSPYGGETYYDAVLPEEIEDFEKFTAITLYQCADCKKWVDSRRDYCICGRKVKKPD